MGLDAAMISVFLHTRDRSAINNAVNAWPATNVVLMFFQRRRRWANIIPCISSMSCVRRGRLGRVHITDGIANTKNLYNIYTTSAQRLRRWSNIVQIIYKCFVFAGGGTYATPQMRAESTKHSLTRPIPGVSFRLRCHLVRCGI